MEGKIGKNKINEKYAQIIELWKSGNGVVILKLFETSHYEAHAREFALIKSLGINNITNVLN